MFAAGNFELFIALRLVQGWGNRILNLLECLEQ